MRWKFVLLTSLCLLFWAYSFAKSFRMAPSEPLRANATVYEVRGRQGLLIRQRLHFGPYSKPYVRRSAIQKWMGTTGVPGIFAAEHMQGRQSIRFSLTEGSDTVSAETVTNVKSTDLIIGERRNSLPNVILDVMATGTARQANNFSAYFHQASSGQEWELFLDNTAAQLLRKEAAGFLRSDNSYYSIIPVWLVERKGKIASLPFGAIRLELQDASGQTRAAVNLSDGGEVHLDPSLTDSERLLLSSVCAALLLQSVID